jgi:hypothetical protein
MILYKNIVLGVGLLMLAGCACGPDRWAELLETQVRCGMSPPEVKKLSGRNLAKLDTPSHRGTHVIGEEGDATEVWLTFSEDRLQAVQLGWMYRLKRMAYAQKAELCTASPMAPSRPPVQEK